MYLSRAKLIRERAWTYNNRKKEYQGIEIITDVKFIKFSNVSYWKQNINTEKQNKYNSDVKLRRTY